MQIHAARVAGLAFFILPFRFLDRPRLADSSTFRDTSIRYSGNPDANCERESR